VSIVPADIMCFYGSYIFPIKQHKQ
jgi:hypothetical protein